MRWTRPLTRKANPDTRCERDDPRLMSRSAHPDVNYPDAPFKFRRPDCQHRTHHSVIGA